MADRIFFNPGDSLININDYNEAVRKGQLFKRERDAGELVIAKGPDDEEYGIFYVNDALPEDHASHPKGYDIKKKL